MTDETRVPPPENEAAMTPEEVASLGRDMERRMVELWDRLNAEGPAFFLTVFADILRGGLRSLRHYIEDPEEKEVSWENPWTELHFSMAWDWENEGPIFHRPEVLPSGVLDHIRKGRPTLSDEQVCEIVVAALAQSSPHLLLLHLTNEVAFRFKGGVETGVFVFSPELRKELDALPEDELAARMDALRRPFSIGGLEAVDEDGDRYILTSFDHPEVEPGTLPEWAEEVERRRKDLPELHFTGEVNGFPYKGAVVIMVHPLVVDEDEREAYFPITTGLVIVPNYKEIPEKKSYEAEIAVDPSTWSEEERAALWDSLLETLPSDLLKEGEASATAGKEATAEASGVQAVAEAGSVAVESTPASVHLKEVGAPSPERLALSIMSPYPVPRSLAKDAQSASLHRGLGRMFGSTSRIPDLDRLSEAALREAEALFWTILGDYLDETLSKRTPPSSWRREDQPNNPTAIVLFGIQENEARTLWTEALQRMGVKRESAAKRGPGLDVAEPSFRSENHIDPLTRQVVIRTRLLLWPEENLTTAEGDLRPSVRFRTDTSPGYLDLLARQGPRPFFADGWLWLPRGNEREGFRIAGLPRLLFPEGRKALERITRKDKAEGERKLQDILRNPTLFQDEDAKVVRELRAAIARTEAWLQELSLYDTRDLILCIFEAWYRQRDAWVREAVTLENGTTVSTSPHRIIRLDPEDLRVRLEPKATATTANWRNRLFKKLEALTTFERQTRDVEGRKVDVGDRLVQRVIDGLRGVDEARTPDQDLGLGLARLLRKAGGIPSKSFYLVVSVDFMERLVTWAVDETGAVRWGLEAAKAAERKALIAGSATPREAKAEAEEKRKAVRRRPYFTGSPRLMSLSNLEEWPAEVKDLAHALLQERTRKARTIRKNGRAFAACAGSHGRGYNVRAWMNKCGSHLLRTGPGGGVKAFATFVKALRFLSDHNTLSVQVELKPGSKWNENALAVLEAYKDNPPAVYELKLVPYLPVDLEDRLRERLSEDGILAVDESEAEAFVVTASAPGVLSPADIREARKRAGWGQEELAVKVGVSRPALSTWENAKKPIPQDRMEKLREVLAPYLNPKKGKRSVTDRSRKDPSA